ncbi:MAG: 4Fe-4S dicluster domain-containing protein [Lentisphaerae bacterium]|nr:4Fe-4S dicluster domain-containing protein [Lentisphaerota bacterium]
MKKIKLARIVVSTCCFFLICAGFSGICYAAGQGAKLEFFPAFAAGSLVAVFWFLAALIWGRVFCSWGCPLGYIQDIAGFLGRKLRRAKSIPQAPRRLLRYSAGIFLLVIFAFGCGALFGFFEPFSVTGRFFNSVLRPAFQYVGNQTHLWYFSEITPVAWGITAAGTLFMLLIAGAAFFRERLFCNTLCPVGFMLGLFAKMAKFRLQFSEKCVKCKGCEKVCKGGCIDVEKGVIDSERCVVCGNCLAVCRFDGLKGKGSFLPDQAVENFDGKRRVFLAGLAVAGAAGATGVRVKCGSAGKTFPCAPPGAGDVETFNMKCTGCQLCVANCPGKVLTPALFEYGLAGMGQPRMSTANGFCDPECSRCSNICPTGALKPLTLPEKKRCRVGMVTYYRNRCVVVVDEESCGACAEHCPTGALEMVPYKNGLTIPKVTPELCVGCGGCEYICPVRPQQAVIVNGLRKQEVAADPAKYRSRDEKKNEKPAADDAFPF